MDEVLSSQKVFLRVRRSVIHSFPLIHLISLLQELAGCVTGNDDDGSTQSCVFEVIAEVVAGNITGPNIDDDTYEVCALGFLSAHAFMISDLLFGFRIHSISSRM